MLQLRLEVVSSENINDVCAQASRIATTLGIATVFSLDGKDTIAQPGVNAETLVEECSKKGKRKKEAETKPE